MGTHQTQCTTKKTLTWIKAHTRLEKALGLGFTKEDWKGIGKADELSTEGTTNSYETTNDLRDLEERKNIILETQRYLPRRPWVLVNIKITKDKIKDGREIG